MIRFTCPHCGQALNADGGASDRKIKCGFLAGKRVRVPGIDQTTEYDRLMRPPAKKRGGTSCLVAAMVVTAATGGLFLMPLLLRIP